MIGGLLMSGTLYAEEGLVTSQGETFKRSCGTHLHCQLVQFLDNPAQVKKIKAYRDQHFHEYVSSRQSVMKAKKVLIDELFSAGFNQKQFQADFDAFKKEESKAGVQAMMFLRYLYTDVATHNQQATMLKMIKQNIERPDYHFIEALQTLDQPNSKY